MKIGCVYDNIYPYTIGGAEKREWELATRLAMKGHEVHLFSMKYWEGPDVFVKEGVYLHGVCSPQPLFINGRRSIKEAIYFAYKVLKPLFEEKFDIVDVTNFPYFPCFSAKLAALMKRTPLIITWHEVWDNYWFEYLGKKGIFGKVVEKVSTHLSDKMVTVSEATKRDLERIGFKKDIKVIPNGIDFRGIRKIRPSTEDSDIIFVGRLIKEKNVDLLIEAMSLIKRESPGINCIIVGDGPERGNLERLIYELNLEDNVHLKGVVENHDQVLSYMKSSKVFVLPSTREGFGIVALEANACGLPIVTVKHHQNAACDLINEGENGFISELSEQDIAQKIKTILINEQSLENKCIEYSKKFDWGIMVDLIEETYRQVVSYE